MTNQLSEMYPPLERYRATEMAKILGVSRQRMDQILKSRRIRPVPGTRPNMYWGKDLTALLESRSAVLPPGVMRPNFSNFMLNLYGYHKTCEKNIRKNPGNRTRCEQEVAIMWDNIQKDVAYVITNLLISQP